MQMRYTIGIAAAALLALAVAGLAAETQEKQAPKGDADFRAAWLAFAAPASDPEKSSSREAREEARMAAIPLMEAAVAADPRSWIYQESLGYVCLAAGRYDKAKTAIDKAIDRKRDRPLLYMLRGQAEAALAQMNPPEAGKSIGPAITALDRAAQIDPLNALPLLQAASVAFDVDRPDLAVSRIGQALQRPGSMLYTLMVPTDLGEDQGASLRVWQYIQLGHWYELLARFRNDSRNLLNRGARLEQTKDLAGADQQYRWALQVGRQVAGMQPNLFINVAAGLDMMEDAYTALGRVSEASGSREAERWKGEAGVVTFARSQLAAALDAYVKEITKGSPPTVQELLITEGKMVAPIIAGVGLSPQPSPPAQPAGKPSPQAKPTRLRHGAAPGPREAAS